MSFRQKLCNLFSKAYNFIKGIFKGDDADYLTYNPKFLPYILPNKPKKKRKKKKKISLAKIAESHTQHIKAHQEVLKNAIKSEKKAKKKAKKVSKK